MNDRNYGTDASFTGCPKDYPDPLVDAGSLFLLHMPLSWPSASAPVNGSVFQNIAWAQAAAQIGSGDAASLAGVMTVTGAADEVILEVTPKKGLHGICSLTTQEQNDYALISLPAALCEHIRTKMLTDTFYVEAWYRTTRKATYVSAPMLIFGGSATGDYHLKFLESGNQPSSATDRDPVLDGGFDAVGNQIRTAGRLGFTGSVPAAAGLGIYWLWGATSSLWQNKAASRVLYRLHIKNLSESGTTWAQEDAAGQAAFTAAFSPGGEFYGDTLPTDPTGVA